MGRIEVLIRAGRLAQVEDEASRIQNQIEQFYGLDSVWAGRMHVMLGMLHLRKVFVESSVIHYGRALEIWQKHFNLTHPDIIRVSMNLAFALQHTEGGRAVVEKLYRELLAMFG